QRRPWYRIFSKQPDTLGPKENEKINYSDWRHRTCLHYACQNGDIDMVEYLLKCGAEGNRMDTDGNTPFSLALSSNEETLAILLLQLNQSYERGGNEQNLTCLHLACY